MYSRRAPPTTAKAMTVWVVRVTGPLLNQPRRHRVHRIIVHLYSSSSTHRLEPPVEEVIGPGKLVDREIQTAVKAQRLDAATLRRFVDNPLIGDKLATEWDVALLQRRDPVAAVRLT